jgi:NOL1/NOP2/sun family putative RNA methylase
MIPAEFLSRMETMLGPEYPAFLSALERPLQKGLRLSRRKILSKVPFVTEPIPWAENGYYYDPDTRPGKHPYHEAGLYYLQEPSAMAPAGLLSPQPGDRVLDLCAAPGGKSTQLGDMLEGQGLLVANEINPKRAKILSRNIERMGIPNALVLNMHPRDLEGRFPEFFDKILVDAPCSGEGMFRKEEAAVTDWSQATVEMCAGRQAEILDSAAKMLRPGGLLCYSTCTFSPEEDEGAVAAFLSRHPDFHIVHVDAPWFAPGDPQWATPKTPQLSDTFRLWPHKLSGEGHYAALLQRDGDGSGTPLPPPASVPMPKELRDFLEALEITLPEGKVISFGPSLYLVPEALPELRGLKVLRPGLELGQVKKGRFEPAHALALWLKTAKSTADFSADSQEILRYLQGQVLSGPQTGWTLVTVDGLSLGWAKGSGGQLKNHFPKGLRWV